MKKLITSVSTTIRAFKLLSNPLIVDKLYQEVSKATDKARAHTSTLGAKDLYYHKHYLVQIVN
jgi:hypothetical protein